VTTPTHAPIKWAFVERVRASSAYATLTGVHEGFAPEKKPYPFLVYNLVAGPYEYNWGDETLIAMIDATVFSRNSVQADNLDAELTAALSDQPFPVEGQTSLLCRRMATIPNPPDIDNEGEKVYGAGGTYEIWTVANPSVSASAGSASGTGTVPGP
jgi:hypothetical protein